MDGPLGTQKQSKQEDVKIWKDEKDIELLSMVKFAQEFLILIMQTAALLNGGAVHQPSCHARDEWDHECRHFLHGVCILRLLLSSENLSSQEWVEIRRSSLDDFLSISPVCSGSLHRISDWDLCDAQSSRWPWS